MAEFDAVIIGSGHNGLGLACYLGRSGMRVLVCEAAAVVGGFLNTEEVIPGYRHSLHAITLGSYPPFYRDFDLSKHGLTMLKVDVEFGLLMGKRALVIHNGLLKENFKNFSKFSEKDARTLAVLHNKFHRTWLQEFYSQPKPTEERGIGLESDQRSEWKRICSMSPREVIDEFFESEMVKLFIASRVIEENADGHGLVASNMTLDFRGVGDHVFRVLTDPQYLLAQGGTHSLAEALARQVTALGGEILTDSPVEEALVNDGKAVGVRLVDGKVYSAAKLVVCNTGMGAFLDFVGHALDESLVKKIGNIRTPVSGKLDLHIASNEPPRYEGADDPQIDRSLNVFVGYDDLSDLETHANDIKEGRFPQKPSFHGGCLSLYDHTVAPPGKYALWEWQFVSGKVVAGASQDKIDEYRDRILSRWREFAPNLTKSNLLGVHVAATQKGGHKSGYPSAGWGQSHYGRPTPELSGYRTPIKGLYLCHSSGHPGGQVRFAAALNAFKVIAEDLGLRKWWSEPAPGQPYAVE